MSADRTIPARLVWTGRVLSGLAAALTAAWIALTRLTHRTTDRSVPFAVAMACGGSGVVIMLSGYASGGQLGIALAADAPAKYLNSPETPLFHKGSNLYNGAVARQAVHDGAALIVVEGYVDVIAMVTAGYPATVAPLGTALTEDQLGLLWKMADEPILCFDGDKAGQRAAFRAVDMAMPRLKPGKSLRFAMLPEGQDPDDLYRSGGREAIAEVLAGARPLGEMLWIRETEAASFDTPERRAAFEARIHEVVASIGGFATGRFTTPAEVAALITFLASDRAGNITGVNYLIDGGLIKTT